MARTRKCLLVGAALCVTAAACSSKKAPASAGSTTTTAASHSPSTAAPLKPALTGGWETYHGDAQRTGEAAPGVKLGNAQIAWTSAALDGQVYAEPLFWAGLVIVATTNDTLYGLSATSGQIVWSTNVGRPVPLSALQCGDVDPLGILGTPVIDPVTGHLFAVAETLGGGAIGHELVALDPATGKLVFQESDVPGGMNSADQQQRPALLVEGGRVYANYGGLYGDCGTYTGWVVAAPTAGPGPLISYRVNTPNQSAVWAPPGAVVDAAGGLLVATGNGQSTHAYDYGDSVIKLSPTLQVLDSYAPSMWSYYNGHDLDLGSTSPALVDGGRYVFIVGKQSQGYLLNEAHLGGIGGQVFEAPACFAIGGDAVEGDDVYVSCLPGIKDVRVNPATNPPSFSVAWSAPVAATDPPILADNTLWSVGGSTLYGLDPSNGAVQQRLPLGATADKFVTPSIGDGEMVVGAGNTVRAFVGS